VESKEEGEAVRKEGTSYSKTSNPERISGAQRVVGLETSESGGRPSLTGESSESRSHEEFLES